MSIVLALTAALAYGSADFVGGLAARRRPPALVALGAQVTGLALLLGALPFVGSAAPSAATVGLGMVAGLFGGTGLVLLLRSLARGPMSVVAPTTALAASSVPILAGLVTGERPGPMALVGMVVAFAAVGLITREPGETATVSGVAAGSRRGVVGGALVAGTVFGMFFVVLHGTGDDAGLWPLVGARLASIPLLAIIVGRQGGWELGEGLRPTPQMLASGFLDMAANIAYLLALRHGMLSVVAAVTGLYPAATVVLAQSKLQERLAAPQLAGLGVAVGAAVLVAI
jgi:drug/metabolite transporter (DMT)-like permease